MSARSLSSSSADDGTAGANSAANMLADLPRRQLAMLSQSASVLYRGSEAVRQLQQQAAQRASEHHQEAAEKLRDSRDLNEMMAIQTELLRFNLQESAQYWQQLATTMLKVQAEMISGAGQVLDSGAEPTLDALQRSFEATLNDAATAAPH